MSAVFGIVNYADKAAVPALGKRMSSALQQHGPERDTQWVESGVLLGHRLMAFTPEDCFGTGIEHSDCGRYVLTGEGRVDNRAELVEQLGLDARQVALWSDTRFMLKAWERWGHEAGIHMYGGFCFAVWDKQAQSLSLVRDPLGYGHSLFYYQGKNFFVFSSAIKGLLAIPKVPYELSKEKLADFLMLKQNNHRTTHYQDILRLPPAHYLTVAARAGTSELNRYWQPDLKKRIRFANDQDYVDAFNEIFNRSVGDNLRSITPVAAFMSGGVDSSAVATTAALQLRQQGKQLHTYTAVPRKGFTGTAMRGAYNDETPLVQAIAQMHDNLIPHFIDAQGETPLDKLSEYFDAQEAPLRNPSNRVWYEAILREGQASNRRVMLTGEQGNMTLSWDGAEALADWLRQGRWIKFYRGLSALTGYRHITLGWHLKRAVKTALPDLVWAGYRQLRQAAKLPVIAKSCGINPEFVKTQRVFERAKDLGLQRIPANGRAARWSLLAGIDNLGDYCTGYRASFGVELRDPTADRRLIEFCLAIPQKQFLGNGEPRWLVKRALQDQLPVGVLHCELRGEQDPGWYERLAGVRQQIASHISRPNGYLEKSEVMNLQKLQGIMDNWPDQGADWNTYELVVNYRLCLLRCVMVGAFLDWYELRR